MVPVKPILSGDMISVLSLFPNPSICSVSLSGLNSGDQITVYETNGSTTTQNRPLGQLCLSAAGFCINVLWKGIVFIAL